MAQLSTARLLGAGVSFLGTVAGHPRAGFSLGGPSVHKHPVGSPPQGCAVPAGQMDGASRLSPTPAPAHTGLLRLLLDVRASRLLPEPRGRLARHPLAHPVLRVPRAHARAGYPGRRGHSQAAGWLLGAVGLPSTHCAPPGRLQSLQGRRVVRGTVPGLRATRPVADPATVWGSVFRRPGSALQVGHPCTNLPSSQAVDSDTGCGTNGLEPWGHRGGKPRQVRTGARARV